MPPYLLIENGVLGFWFWLEISSWGLGLGFSLVCSLWVFLWSLGFSYQECHRFNKHRADRVTSSSEARIFGHQGIS